jgi:hypothetical protein
MRAFTDAGAHYHAVDAGHSTALLPRRHQEQSGSARKKEVRRHKSSLLALTKLD